MSGLLGPGSDLQIDLLWYDGSKNGMLTRGARPAAGQSPKDSFRTRHFIDSTLSSPTPAQAASKASPFRLCSEDLDGCLAGLLDSLLV